MAEDDRFAQEISEEDNSVVGRAYPRNLPERELYIQQRNSA